MFDYMNMKILPVFLASFFASTISNAGRVRSGGYGYQSPSFSNFFLFLIGYVFVVWIFWALSENWCSKAKSKGNKNADAISFTGFIAANILLILVITGVAAFLQSGSK